MKATRPIISVSESLQLLLQSGSLWLGEKTGSTDLLSKKNSTQTAAPFLIPEIDLVLDGGLALGQIHEWRSFFLDKSVQTKTLIPPHLILCSLFRNLLQQDSASNSKKVIIWIGKECWPSVHLLNLLCQNLDYDWQRQVLLIDPQSKQERLSAFRSCLSSKAVLATVGDASSFNLIATRQLQFAARTGGGMGILLRREESSGLPAYTKWIVEPALAQPALAHPTLAHPTLAHPTLAQPALAQPALAHPTLAHPPSSPLKGIRALSSIVSWNLSLLKAPGLTTPQTWAIELEKTGLLLKQKQQLPSITENRKSHAA